ncbi:DNA-binding transcriptional LysR family regulator [Neorhizobium galegae]|uniref:LysR family transcriptional regulator n=1 Tax=Neorhizobium galegae TaxID=399 RepID=UPI001AEAB7B2|nr:LysR family transcriptional regulator [Neorhizobium galegae]MBP2563420.1 DNA-binding transcriptional LysR family regulator [Neorhizobium galegae]MDQ0138213.1 DNA-binding transcriptional LysR family regulator [Neorhizobium galegae]
MPFDGRVLSGLGVLAAVIECGSFVKAAELIGMTDSGVSRAIGRLESRLGVRLMDRTTRSLVLTDEGRRFYEEVKPHLDAIESAAALASGASSAVRGRLKVDIDPFFLPLVLAGQLGRFCERYPDLVIEFVTREHVGDLVADGIDMAIRFGQPRLSTLVSRKLIEAPILTVASPHYLARRGRPSHPSDLAKHSCLQFLDPHSGRPYEWEFIRGQEKVEVETSGPLTFTDPKSLLAECLSGTGVAQVIGWGAGAALENGELIDLFPDWHGEQFPLFAFHPSRNHPPAKVGAFIDFCLEMAMELQRRR